MTTRGNPGGLFWAWVDATPPPPVRAAVWGLESPPDWGLAGVQPEQVRLATYTALAAGYRGVGFRGDADLTQPRGRPLLIELGLLNEEIDLFESILAQGADPIPLRRTDLTEPVYHGAAGGLASPHPSAQEGARPAPDHPRRVDRDPRPSRAAPAGGRLRARAQYQPPQMAINDLKITVPVPESAQAFEISPGEVRVLDHVRVPGGRQITVPEFSVTSMVLVTTDMGLKDRIEAAMARVRPRAVALAIEQAQLQLQGVLEIHERLVADGHTVRDSAELLVLAEKSIRSASDAQEREDYPLAWSETRRATRPLRYPDAGALAGCRRRDGEGHVGPILPRTPNRPPAVPPAPKDAPLLVTPVASPACVAFQTLPQHYLWVDWMRLGQVRPQRLAQRQLRGCGSLQDLGVGRSELSHGGILVADSTRLRRPRLEQAHAQDDGRGEGSRPASISCLRSSISRWRRFAPRPSASGPSSSSASRCWCTGRSPAPRRGGGDRPRFHRRRNPAIPVHRPDRRTVARRPVPPRPGRWRVDRHARARRLWRVFFDDLRIEPVVAIPPSVSQAVDAPTRPRSPEPPSVRSSAARPEPRGRTSR